MVGAWHGPLGSPRAKVPGAFSVLVQLPAGSTPPPPPPPRCLLPGVHLVDAELLDSVPEELRFLGQEPAPLVLGLAVGQAQDEVANIVLARPSVVVARRPVEVLHDVLVDAVRGGGEVKGGGCRRAGVRGVGSMGEGGEETCWDAWSVAAAAASYRRKKRLAVFLQLACPLYLSFSSLGPRPRVFVISMPRSTAAGGGRAHA